MRDLFEDVTGQDRAVAALRASAARPVHAYLLTGPAGTGKAAAATSFAAALLCETAGTHAAGAGVGEQELCDICRRVTSGLHPDVINIEREGAAIGMDAAREVVRAAYLSPVEGTRKVIILHDFHLVRETGPALLKTLEEPPASTVFVVLAEYLPPELVTIASRCVRVEFDAMRTADLVATLVQGGVEPEQAQHLAEASGGRLDRARLLAADPRFEVRRLAWHSIPTELDGTGATAARIADKLIALMDESVAPLKERQQAEVEELIERNRRNAEVGGSKKARTTKATLNAGLSQLEERHRREQRRQRTDELRTGLATLAAAYRLQLQSGDRRRLQTAVQSVRILDDMVKSLEFNPNEVLALQALLSKLGRLALEAA
ncbi:MAG TPA: ATP-binding protein [Acidimicrobiales bacterium]|nr:ATP-binding protein [Acidimicrobiales bacterium]